MLGSPNASVFCLYLSLIDLFLPLFEFSLQTPVQGFASLDCWLLRFKKKNDGRKYATTREEADEIGRGRGRSRSDRRLCFNYTAEAGFEPAPLRWLL